MYFNVEKWTFKDPFVLERYRCGQAPEDNLMGAP